MEKIWTKQEIRKKIYNFRNIMMEKDWQDNSLRIADRMIQTSVYANAKNIYCYIDYNHEVATTAIIEDAWKKGKRVFVPKVLGKHHMNFYEIQDFSDLTPGLKGILEPKEDLFNEASGEDGLMILPGVAFDRNCHRIGYGGGFYDCYLEAHPNLSKVALAFSFQIFDVVPWEEHDIAPEFVITEDKIYGTT